ncbi:Ig-like domain-containing protein [Polyangium jinanense]|uniref:Ig-like domain-containing protein n=1 Tax=Polyangium jinanense TaxID=2829994 RepID=A0A9X4AWU6_9BACT|nr:Ig-like domain-containing protein [Polyangium jinanense]MDC3959214.1 Ig-like domain-containing protein [Polyangium jinanense]MDC3987694.1 Ig-like domain-containing protein [Polyangium jinanense]
MLFAMAFSAMSMVAAVGCGDDNADDIELDNKTVSDLDLTPDTSSMKKGETLQYTLKVTYSDGTSDGDMSRHARVEWISSDPATATVSADGLVTAIDEGTVTITARFGGEEESETLVIMP